jgi:polysaccharide biosynthesis transport protein
MSFNQFIAIVKARWVVLLSISVLTILGTLGISLMLPKQFTATSELIVDVKSPDPIAGFMLQGNLVAGYMATQVDIIQSDRVAISVVKALRLDQNEVTRQQWLVEDGGRGAFDVWMARKIQQGLEVKPGRESSVIEISYTSQDPKFSVAIVNAFVQSYLEVSLDLRVQPAKQFSSMFESQSKALRDKVEEAQSRLSAYQNEKGLIINDERIDVETARLNELSSQLVAIQSMSAEARSRERQVGENAQEVLNNPLISSLKADLSRQEAKLKEISSKLGSAHPQVLELQSNNAELKNKVASEISRIARSQGINNTVSQYREAQVRSELTAQREKIMKLKASRDQAAVLQRDVENAQRAYDTIQTRLNQMSLEGQTTQTNVTLLTPPSEPSAPTGPKVALNTALAAVLGSMLALGVVLGLELNDRRLRGLEDITEGLGVTALCSMPSVDFTAEKVHQPKTAMLLASRLVPKLLAPKS